MSALDELAREGIDVGLFRPITLNPFPYDACRRAIDKSRRVVVFEMNMGQMIEDIKLAAAGSRQIDFHGTAGGVILSPDEVKEFMLQSLRQAGGAG